MIRRHPSARRAGPPGIRAACVTIILVVAGAACASLVKEPRVALAEVAVQSLTLSGATLQVELEVENPNGFSLNARALEYTLFFQPGDSAAGEDETWRTLTSGRTAESVTLPSNEAVRVPLAIPFRFRDLEDAAASLLRDGALRYRFEGAFTVGSPVGDLRVPFDRTGLLDL